MSNRIEKYKTIDKDSSHLVLAEDCFKEISDDGQYSIKNEFGLIKDVVTKHKFKKSYDELSCKDALGLDAQEINVIKDYTHNGYRDMNRLLYAPERGNYNARERESLKEKIEVLTKLLENRSLEEKGIFYRGLDSATVIFGSDIFKMSLRELRAKYEGMVYVNKGFSSMSFSQKTAEGFSGELGGALMEARIPRGSQALCVGSVGTFGAAEGEILLQRGTSFLINRIDFVKGKFRVKMTAVGVTK